MSIEYRERVMEEQAQRIFELEAENTEQAQTIKELTAEVERLKAELSETPELKRQRDMYIEKCLRGDKTIKELRERCDAYEEARRKQCFNMCDTCSNIIECGLKPLRVKPQP